MTERQLELFSEPAIGSPYRPNDWVKVKKKPSIGAHIKRGEIFKVNAIHPIDGSVRIWNPHINQWDFLYPDEIKLCPTPTAVETVVENLSTVETVVENLSTVETVVENLSTVETVVENLSTVETVVENLSTVETVVENLSTVETVVENLSTVETVVENLSTVETVVENLSTVETVVEDLDLGNRRDSGYNSNGWFDFHYKIRIDGKQHSIRHKQDRCTGPYYTYRWLEGKKQRAKYIPGKKFGEVYRAIAMGQPITEILKIISSPSKLNAILKK